MKRDWAVKLVSKKNKIKKEKIETHVTGGLVKLEPSCLEGNMMLIKILKDP